MIFLYELKKIFRPKTVILLFVIAAAAVSIMLYTVTPWKMSDYTITGDENFGFSMTGFSEGQYAQRYRTFKWFIDSFGNRINDDVIGKISSLEYPILDEYISETEVFRENGISNTKELEALFEKYVYVDEVGFRQFMFMVAYDDDYEDYQRAELLMHALGNVYADYYIQQDEFFQKYGVTSYSQLQKTIRDTEKNGENEKIGQELDNHYWSDTIIRIHHSENIPEFDRINDEIARFLYCYELRHIYDAAKEDPIVLFEDAGTYSSTFSHTRYVCTQNHTWEYDEVLNDYVSCLLPTYEQRLRERAEALGEQYFTLRPVQIEQDYSFASSAIIPTAVCVCVLLAGLYAVNDNKSRIIPLQYSTKTGRKINKHKLAAVVGASVIVNTIFAAGMLMLANMDIYSAYYSLPVSSFASGELFWLDMNMWQYIALNIVFSYIVSAALSVTAYFVCGFCNGNVVAIAACIPVCAAAVALYVFPFAWLFSLPESSVEDPLWLAGVTAVGIGCAAVMMKRERKATL